MKGGVLEMLQFKERKNVLFYLSLLIFSMLAFLLLGEQGYYLIDDSKSYMDIASRMEGVMPIYPFFLHGNKLLFGEEKYLYAVIIEQSVFASICIILFVGMIKKQFQLNYLESYVCFFLACLTFTADMPETMIPREILTEGIAYAAFYLFMAVLLQTVWNKSWKWYGILCMVTLFLAAIRSQMQILFGVCGIACIYIAVFRKKAESKRKILLCCILGMIGCLIIGVSGIWTTSRIARRYQTAMVEMRKQQAQGHTETEKQENTEEPRKEQRFETSQYISLIFNKGMYEADYEDYQLFEEEQVRNLFIRLYNRIDQEKYRYVYATPGLWMWRDLMNSALVGTVCIREQTSYYREEYPELPYDSSYSYVRNRNLVKIATTLLMAHWGRVLYHTLMLLPQAFVSTVFFQIERIYLLCHLITLFLYLSAIVLMIWAYRDKKVKNSYGEFMCSVLITNIIFVVIISVIFIGQKRYLFYNFGIFYIAYFLLLMQLWKHYVRDYVIRCAEKFRKTGTKKNI